jgi:hypothetical protein
VANLCGKYFVVQRRMHKIKDYFKKIKGSPQRYLFEMKLLGGQNILISRAFCLRFFRKINATAKVRVSPTAQGSCLPPQDHSKDSVSEHHLISSLGSVGNFLI